MEPKPPARLFQLTSRHGAKWCIKVYTALMAKTEKSIRRSVSLPARVARQVEALAEHRKVSASRVLVELIETGINTKENEKKRFFELADRLAQTPDAKKREHLKKELARLTFGE